MGSKESSQTTENKPPAWATPLFEQSATEGQNLYNSGSGGNTYTGNMVSPLSGTTMSGVNQLAQAGANTNTAGTRPLLQGIGAASTGPSYSEQNLQGIGGGTGPSYAEQNLQGIGSGTGPSYAERNLGDMASGTYLQNGNPYFDAALQPQLDKTAAQVQSNFSGAGRYGSGANTDVLTNQLGGIRSGALRDQFNADTSNMLAANNQMDAARYAGIDRTMAANSQMDASRYAGMDRTLAANGQMDASRNAGLDRALSATTAMGAQDQQQFQNRLTGAGATLQAGNILDTQSQKQLADQVANWYAQDNQDWTRLGLLQSAAAGSAGNYGTQVATARQPMDVGSLMGGFGALLGK